MESPTTTLDLEADVAAPRNRAKAKPNLLTDFALKALIKSPPARQKDIPDNATPGLSARITPNGHVTWSLRMRVAGEGGQSTRGRRAKGQQYRLSLGTYPTITIKSARATAARYRRQAEAGEHPVRALERKAVARHDTVERLVEAFIAEYAQPNLRSWKNGQSNLNRNLVPKWGKLPVDAVDSRDAAHLLREVALGLNSTEGTARIPRPGAAAELRKWGSLLFSWAVRSGLAANNPFAESKNPTRQKPRQRFLDMEEARALWTVAAELDYPWRPLLQLLLLTACRLREIAHARRSWINLPDARIVIPATVYKTARQFLVALPSRAVDILENMPRWNDGDYLFSRAGGRCPVWNIPRKVTDDVHARMEKHLGRPIDHFVIHDIRRTVRTHLSRLKVAEVVGELVLGHALRGVAGTYNVYDFEAEKREALTTWSHDLAAR